MLTTPHLLVGAAIGASVHNPIIVATGAAGSHFILDSVPHLGFFINVEDLGKKDILIVVGDVLLGLALLLVLTYHNPNAEMIYLGAFCAFLPDFHHTFQVLFGREKLQRYSKLHLRFHYKKHMKTLPGIATQVLTIVAAILVILRAA